MDEVSRLREVVTQFRAAIDRSLSAITVISFRRFPQGSCGDAALLLGRYLRETGFGNPVYISGKRAEYSHGWLQLGNVIIDITADQFFDISESVIVTTDDTWHRQFEPWIHRHCDDTTCIAEHKNDLDAAYQVIVTKLLPEQSV
jgi:hypothetical protein